MKSVLRNAAVVIAVSASLLLAGCAAASTAAPAPAPTDTAQPNLFAAPLASPGVVSAPTEELTSTPGPFALDLTPLPTETALPTLDLPTEAPRAPSVQVWDGLPTYPAESRPDYYFRVQFDATAWALTTDAFGSPALAHRAITNCTITPTEGRGLPPNATVDHDMRRIGPLSFQISSVSVNGVKQSVTYTGGDGRIYTAFQVALEDRPDQCILEAETVLSTLTSVPASEATPIATP